MRPRLSGRPPARHPRSGAEQRTGDPSALTKPASELSSQEVLAGLVERVTFHNAENGFCVLRAKARGHRDLVTVVGHAAIICAGEWITASGEWINDRAHGQWRRKRWLAATSCFGAFLCDQIGGVADFVFPRAIWASARFALASVV